VHLRDGKATVYSRRGYDWTETFAPIAEAAEALPVRHATAVVDMLPGRDDDRSGGPYEFSVPDRGGVMHSFAKTSIASRPSSTLRSSA
jgi:hypothetical protein